MLDWLKRWPLVRQVLTGADGTGPEALSERTRSLHARTRGADVTRSVCPYCAVGCGQLISHRDGRLLSIEGDPQSFINAGTLCPKGAASYELLTHPQRLTRVRYRAPHATEWAELDLDTAMDRVADRVWESRRRTFIEDSVGWTSKSVQERRTGCDLRPSIAQTANSLLKKGDRHPPAPDCLALSQDSREPVPFFQQTVNQTTGIAHLGGATLDNEENYLIKKLFAAGLGIVRISNQARL